MRQYLHTSIVILCLLSVQAHAQWSGAWSNYFATETMAAECYSGSVERCQAVGVTLDAPSWWDYILGKNHAKLVSVKNNIKACRPYYITNGTNALDILNGNTNSYNWTFTAGFTSDVAFLVYCGLPTNTLDETPYFKAQYPGTTGGWHSTRAMLTNMLTVCLNYGLQALTATNGYYGTGVGFSSNSFSEAFTFATNAWTCVLDDTYGHDQSYSKSVAVSNASGYTVSLLKDIPIYHLNTDFSWNPLCTNFLFVGQVFSRVEPINGQNYNSFLDGVSTNFRFVFVWTNAIGQSGQEYIVSDDPLSAPNSVIAENNAQEGWQTDFDYFEFLDTYTYVVQYFGFTNGFKYK
jgi:hypothetical protein